MGPLQRELNRARFILNSYRTRSMSMAKVDKNMLGRFLCRYVIFYINDRIVQGHHVHCLVSRVNIFLQGKVQMMIPTSPIQVSIVESIT